MSTRIAPLLLAVACSSTPVSETPGAPSVEDVTAEVVRVTTRDGVDLVGDLYDRGSGAPAVLLLHMTPKGPWNRTDWSPSFVADLGAAGLTVLAIDRRGAGASGGTAADAFTGPNGKLDVAASTQLLKERGATDIWIVGASNGTTSMVDYTAAASTEGWPSPSGLVYFTGGTYTENQTSLADLTVLPSLFVYGTAEADWSETYVGQNDGVWRFEAIQDGAHGTRMFEGPEDTQVRALIAGWIAEASAL